MFAAKNTAAPSGEAVYVESVFSTYLYTGTGASQTITNNINISTNGGLVWIKGRSGATGHRLTDTVRGATKSLESNSTAAEATESTGLTAFGTTGFTIGADADYNTNTATYVSWTFREQAKFFDVVTYTGNGTQGRSVSHNLGSAPGWMVVKRTDGVDNWRVYHRSLGGTKFMSLDTTAAAGTANTLWNDADPTSTVFYLGNDASVNGNGMSYVAYLFAHDAGGFGASGADNVISCGSFTTSAGGTATVTLGYEPQFLLVKTSAVTGSWQMIDIMRGMPVGSACSDLAANSSAAEGTGYTYSPTATGFTFATEASRTYIYIAIRRGPMKTPTSATTVFGLNARTGTGAIATVTGSTGVDDAVLIKNRGAAVGDLFAARLTGTGYLETSSSATEVAAGTTILQANPWDVMDGVKVGTTSTITNASANTFINYLFSRAPGFFDVVCYTGTGSAGVTVSHNLGVAPELIITRVRNFTGEDWVVSYSNGSTIIAGYLNKTDAFANSSTAPSTDITSLTSTTYTLNTSNRRVNGLYNYVAYLFATVAGVSKVGSYTGTGALQTINCGFAAGARFVLIKRTDTTGDWWVYDSARGISSGNDPYLFLNSTAAEVTGTNYVDTASTGFQVTAAAPAGLNANGGTYIFLAIA